MEGQRETALAPVVDDWVDPGPEPEPERPRDWAWVQEWREGREPTPWGPGMTIAIFVAVVIGVAIYVLSAGLADQPWLALAVNLLVAGGVGPALWMSRSLPVLRWVAGGAAVGILLGWIAALVIPAV